jgi:ribosomal protein S10
VSIDINAQESEDLNQLMNLAEISKQKVSRKNNPTFLVKRNDRLTKIKAKHFNQKFSTHFSKSFEKEIV